VPIALLLLGAVYCVARYLRWPRIPVSLQWSLLALAVLAAFSWAWFASSDQAFCAVHFWEQLSICKPPGKRPYGL